MPRTSPTFVADPVVASTNQGNANTVIDDPIDDTTSAATMARIGVELSVFTRLPIIEPTLRVTIDEKAWNIDGTWSSIVVW